jgi:uncharacterized protein YdeI (YjbR/CyaY-like superfamily)
VTPPRIDTTHTNMGTRDPRIDAYIEKSADFARPILLHLREVVHAACPDVEETMKWSFPHFMYGDGILCSMASFKGHCAFGFWNGGQVVGESSEARERAMGHFGRITSVKDLPPKKEIASYVKEAMKLKEAGVKRAAPSRTGRPKEVAVPEALAAALERNAEARAAFERFSPSHRREYAEWVAEAKTDATRERRVATTIEWVTEGKSRNWKYERC